MNKILRRLKRKRRGFILLTFLIDMAVLSILAAGALGLFAMMMKLHHEALAELALQQQLRFAAAGIIRDVNYADDAQAAGGKLILSTRRGDGRVKKIVYEVKEGRLIKDSQPVTGDEKNHVIWLQEFFCEKKNEMTVLFRLSAMQQSVRRTFTLETAAVHLPQIMPTVISEEAGGKDAER